MPAVLGVGLGYAAAAAAAATSSAAWNDEPLPDILSGPTLPSVSTLVMFLDAEESSAAPAANSSSNSNSSDGGTVYQGLVPSSSSRRRQPSFVKLAEMIPGVSQWMEPSPSSSLPLASGGGAPVKSRDIVNSVSKRGASSTTTTPTTTIKPARRYQAQERQPQQQQPWSIAPETRPRARPAGQRPRGRGRPQPVNLTSSAVAAAANGKRSKVSTDTVKRSSNNSSSGGGDSKDIAVGFKAVSMMKFAREQSFPPPLGRPRLSRDESFPLPVQAGGSYTISAYTPERAIDELFDDMNDSEMYGDTIPCMARSFSSDEGLFPGGDGGGGGTKKGLRSPFPPMLDQSYSSMSQELLDGSDRVDGSLNTLSSAMHPGIRRRMHLELSEPRVATVSETINGIHIPRSLLPLDRASVSSDSTRVSGSSVSVRMPPQGDGLKRAVPRATQDWKGAPPTPAKEPVIFSCFAPPAVRPGTSFALKVSSYLKRARDAVLRGMLTEGVAEAGRPDGMEIAKGKRVTVQLVRTV